MIAGATIASIITVVACLFLVTRGSALRKLGTSGLIRLALIWGAIILGLTLLIEIIGSNVI
jgi:hypothetical protein